MILIAVLLFVATEILLYYRWATMIEPTCVLVLYTGPQLKGAQVVVDGVLLPQPHKLIVGEGDRYALPFYVEPGLYTIKVKQNDQIVFDQSVEFATKERGRSFDLTKLPPAPASASTLPATQQAPYP
jgi:hypothetical protein